MTSLRNMILEEDTPLHVHNPRKITRKLGVLVSQHEERSIRCLKSAGLWTTFPPFLTAMNNLLTLFIYLFILIDIYLIKGYVQLF